MDADFDGKSRLETAKLALKDMLVKYSELGDVKVQLGTFNEGKLGAQSFTNWMTVSEAILVLMAISNPDGGTNFDYALEGMQFGFEADGKIPDAKNVSYFLSDGKPTLSSDNDGISVGQHNNGGTTDSNLGDGIDGAEQTAWEAYVNNHAIKSYAVAIGDNVSVNYLQPIVYDGEAGVNMDAIMPSDLADLSDALVDSVVSPGRIYIGTDGEDVIVGGLGEDFMTGNDGADSFVFDVAFMNPDAVETDTIIDFDRLEGDKLDLSDLLNVQGSGDLDNYLNFESLNGDTLVHVNKDGEFAIGADADQIILLKGVDLTQGGLDDNQIIEDLINSNNLIIS